MYTTIPLPLYSLCNELAMLLSILLWDVSVVNMKFVQDVCLHIYVMNMSAAFIIISSMKFQFIVTL